MVKHRCSFKLKIKQAKLHIANDLANFPVPFFNITTSDKTVLPIVFATVPDESTIKAASIVSSYGGVLTKWRGIDYPVLLTVCLMMAMLLSL